MAQRIIRDGNEIAIDRSTDVVERNHFDLSNSYAYSCNFGALVPACIMEVLPNSDYHLNTEAIVRFQPMIAPPMHNFRVHSEWFFVPNRLLWPNWEQFISPSVEGSAAPAMPYFNGINVTANSLADYLRMPIISNTGGTNLSALPFAAYQRIVWDWYTDENFTSMDMNNVPTLVDGNNTAQFISTWGALGYRLFDADYFTSNLPWPQKSPTIIIPAFHGPLPVTDSASASSSKFSNVGGSNIPAGSTTTNQSTMAAGGAVSTILVNGVSVRVSANGQYEVSQANMTALAGTIEELRRAELLQEFFEADARGGTRYIETLWQHFRSKSSDARLQRAEYIGRTVQPIAISEVLNTTGTATAAQGTMAGHGIAVTQHETGMSYHAEEHGFIICMASVVPASAYYQGMPKMYWRSSRFDYAWPSLATLGEQPTYNGELYYTGGSTDTQTFGYLPRYTEYRMIPNTVGGDFKTSLDYWHDCRKFASLPALNQAFVSVRSTNVDDNNLLRIFAVTDPTVQHILCHWYHSIKAVLPLPVVARPAFG